MGGAPEIPARGLPGGALTPSQPPRALEGSGTEPALLSSPVTLDESLPLPHCLPLGLLNRVPCAGAFVVNCCWLCSLPLGREVSPARLSCPPAVALPVVPAQACCPPPHYDLRPTPTSLGHGKAHSRWQTCPRVVPQVPDPASWTEAVLVPLWFPAQRFFTNHFRLCAGQKEKVPAGHLPCQEPRSALTCVPVAPGQRCPRLIARTPWHGGCRVYPACVLSACCVPGACCPHKPSRSSSRFLSLRHSALRPHLHRPLSYKVHTRCPVQPSITIKPLKKTSPLALFTQLCGSGSDSDIFNTLSFLCRPQDSFEAAHREG